MATPTPYWGTSVIFCGIYLYPVVSANGVVGSSNAPQGGAELSPGALQLITSVLSGPPPLGNEAADLRARSNAALSIVYSSGTKTVTAGRFSRSELVARQSQREVF